MRAMSALHSDDIATAIRTRHLQTPITRVLSYPADTPSRDVVDALEEAQFDFAPVTEDDEIFGYVRRADLKDPAATLRPHVRPLTASRVIAGDTPLAHLLPALRMAEFLFVVDGHDIVGVVSPADLNKQPGRTYFYLLVSAFELCLAERIRQFFPIQEKALSILSEGVQARVRERLNEEAQKDVVADVVAAMDFLHLLKVVEKTDSLRRSFGDYSANRWRDEVLNPINDLRNGVMHSVRMLTDHTSDSLSRLIDLEGRLRSLLDSQPIPVGDDLHRQTF